VAASVPRSSPVAPSARRHQFDLVPVLPRTVAIVPATRRHLVNAAAQETLVEDIKLAALIVALACCAGAGLAVGLHWDDMLAEFRLMHFASEEPRWLRQFVDSL